MLGRQIGIWWWSLIVSSMTSIPVPILWMDNFLHFSYASWKCQIPVFSGHDMKYWFCQTDSPTLGLKLGDKNKERIQPACSISCRDKSRGSIAQCLVFSIASSNLNRLLIFCGNCSSLFIGLMLHVTDFDCGPIWWLSTFVPAQFSKHDSLAFLKFPELFSILW